MGNGDEADGCGVLPGITPKKETEQNHETLCTAVSLVLPSMKRGDHRTALQWLYRRCAERHPPTTSCRQPPVLSSGRLATGASCSEFEKGDIQKN